jgi:hypothetical protein
MKNRSLAPCGVICDLCLAFQRTKNRCVGCNNEGNKPYHCTVCSIKSCEEKDGDPEQLCSDCRKFPCRRIKDLDKRYRTKYGENLITNLETASSEGLTRFIKSAHKKWTCKNCGELLCVHRESCLYCGAENEYFPQS